jgi:hypothetical protein
LSHCSGMLTKLTATEESPRSRLRHPTRDCATQHACCRDAEGGHTDGRCDPITTFSITLIAPQAPSYTQR